MNKKEILFGAGCFWGVEETLRTTKGVVETEVGYAGGTTTNPTYEDVCGHGTGHAEVVRVVYDTDMISDEKLLRTFYGMHDPTQIDRQGPDRGDQYRSVVFYSDVEQEKIAQKIKSEDEKLESIQYATQILPAPRFYPAEDYHQKYLMKRDVKMCH